MDSKTRHSCSYRLLALVGLMGLTVTAAKLSPNAGKQCSKLVPGLDKMSLGIDVTSFDLYSKDNIGMKHQVIQYTCNNNKKTLIDGKEYDLPDQVDSVTSLPGGISNSVTQLVTTYRETREAVSANLGVEVAYMWFAFSASASMKSMQSSIYNRSRYIEQVSAYESARRAHLIPDFILQLHQYPQHFIDTLLPADFNPLSATEDNPYRQFIGYFGTHYFKNANFGGLLLVDIETKSDYYRSHDESEVRLQAKASFFIIVGISGGFSSAKLTEDAKFKTGSTVSARYFGGSTNLLAKGGFQQWQPTVSVNPWLFSGQLEPIANLIRNADKKAAMERAITDYILRPYLDELSRLLSSRQWVWQKGYAKLQQLQTRVSELKTEALLTVAKVSPVADEVVRHVDVPLWFSKETQLCLDWYADADKGQCYADSSRVCASPGLMTSTYRDDSNSRSGACLVSWGLTAKGHDAWFNDVQICFRWHPDGDGMQCGGAGVARELCANVNSFTKHYRDDTDDRSGGCMMSWRIVVPDTAPVWSQNIQLCFVWWPGGDGTQCGGGADRRLCALAGEWTPYYKDETDKRRGGCRQTWGISVHRQA